MVMAYEKGLPPTMVHDTIVAWHIKNVIFLFLKGPWHVTRDTAHDQTRQVTRFFDHVIVCSLMTNKICYISNSTNAMDTKLDKLVAYDIGKTLKKSHRSYQKVFTIYVIFIHLRIAPLILHRATIRLLLLIREKEPPILTFLGLYVNLHEIHGSIW